MITCRKCGATNVTVYEWESSDGAFVDHRYDCPDCGFSWWVDGPDA
jgi:transposase-like protein